jgi:membrane protease YdiL (CAAX protease family)
VPNLMDFVLASIFAVAWPLYTYFVEWPRHVRRVEAGDPTARLAIYRRTLVQEWAFTAAIVAMTIAFARPFTSLGLRAPEGWRLALGAGLPLLYLALLVLQVPAIAKSEPARARLRNRLGKLSPLIPHRSLEWAWFQPLAVTAGICEELMFRGYLIWVLTPFLGLWGAAGVSVVVFGLGHSYQGGRFGFRAFAAGLGLQLLALATGSIVPGMVFHALIDLGSGYVTYLAMREAVEASPVAA